MLQITCHTYDKLSIDDIADFQGDLKKRTSEDTEKIIKSLHKNGFAFPFFIWKNNGVNFCLDGHGRLGALKKMRADGETISELPVVYVDAETEQDAKVKLLQVNSQYGRIDVDVLHDFAAGIDLDQFSLPELGKASFIFEKAPTEQRETVRLFKYNIPCSADERKMIEDYMENYLSEHGAYLGVFARMFGKETSVEYGEFVEDVPVETLQGADYNPREIDKKKIETLAESIKFCGFCRPVIVNRRNGITIAGHQRTKASMMMGRTHVPVYYTHASERGEMVINQIHNALEDNTGDRHIRVPKAEEPGFLNISASNIEYAGKQNNFSFNFGVQLLTYGNIDSGVATWDGQVIKNVDYVIACHGLRCPARIYYLPKSVDTETAIKYLYGEYGRFTYESKQKHSYQQTFAQPPQRHTERSVTYIYMNKRIPDFEGKRILDFGAGEAVEANLLKKKGFPVTSLEFFPRLRTKRNDRIDAFSCNYDVERLIRFLNEGGFFDLVICDSVLNSVISTKVEHDVLTCLNAFCKLGGDVVLSTRGAGELKSHTTRHDINSRTGSVAMCMPDKDGITGIMGRHGEWFFQKFHSKDQTRELCAEHGLEVLDFASSEKVITHCRKTAELPLQVVKEAIYAEFNMFYSQTERYNHGDNVWEAYIKALGVEDTTGPVVDTDKPPSDEDISMMTSEEDDFEKESVEEKPQEKPAKRKRNQLQLT